MTHDPLPLAGRTALVTGASSGLGAHLSRVIAAAGANVVLGARRRERVEGLAGEIARGGGRALPLSLDVNDEASMIAGYDAAEAHFGAAVDAIVANAGVNSPGKAVDLAMDDFDAVMRTNVRGVYLTAREGARRLIARDRETRKSGRVVIISSITAHMTDPGFAVYSASKAAAAHLGRVLAREWARDDINVNVICPGYIQTDMLGDWFATPGGRRQLERFPRRRLLAATDLDGLIVHMLSDAAGGLTGASITLDDGQSL